MPNHVHVLFTLRDGESLRDTLQGWKGVSSRLIHKSGRCDLNPFWQPDYFDRLIRSLEHFSTMKAYIREYPAKANLKAVGIEHEIHYNCECAHMKWPDLFSFIRVKLRKVGQ
jgi:hypothetical protein